MKFSNLRIVVEAYKQLMTKRLKTKYWRKVFPVIDAFLLIKSVWLISVILTYTINLWSFDCYDNAIHFIQSSVVVIISSLYFHIRVSETHKLLTSLIISTTFYICETEILLEFTNKCYFAAHHAKTRVCSYVSPEKGHWHFYDSDINVDVNKLHIYDMFTTGNRSLFDSLWRQTKPKNVLYSQQLTLYKTFGLRLLG